MITANICAGRVLQDKFGFGVYNYHNGFNPEKLDTAMDFLTEAEAPFEKEQLLTLEGFSALRRWLNAQDSTYLDNRLRKFQAYSEVGDKPAAHYAMGLDVYATWTSPIRKYGDMINHRLLKAVISVWNLARHQMTLWVKKSQCTVVTIVWRSVMLLTGYMYDY